VLYDVLLFVHIVAAILWVGGGIMLNILGSRAVRSADPARMASIARESGVIGQRIIAPTALVLLAMGVAMVAVSDAWMIGQPWIILGLVGFGLTALTGAFFFGPEGGRLAKIIEERGPAHEVQRRVRRIVSAGRIDLVVLVLIVADMVFKPGL
jgi:uncharacterized membrane protein